MKLHSTVKTPTGKNVNTVVQPTNRHYAQHAGRNVPSATR